MQAFMGMIQSFGFNYPPHNWAFCSGASLGINQYQGLYSLLGTFFGGNGISTFSLPDLRARTPVGSTVMGVSPTVPGTNYPMGHMAGSDKVALTEANLATHTHSATFVPAGGGAAVDVQVSQNTGSEKAPPVAGYYRASAPALGVTFNTFVDDANKGATVALGGVSGGGSSGGNVAVGNSGGGHAFYSINPLTAITFSIAMDGLYPSRN